MTRYQRVVLIGFRGTGKSTVGRRLAQQLNWDYVSTDRRIEELTGQTVTALVSARGWPEFRQLEEQVIEALSGQTRLVVDCGGGVVENETVMQRLTAGSLVVWIDADLPDILTRISRQPETRPLLNQPDLQTDVKMNYQRRIPLYQKYRAIHLNSSQKTVEEICRIIQDEMDYYSG